MQEFANLTSWADANVENIVFYMLAILAIPLAYGVIFDRVIIRAGFLLIGVFSAISGLFLLLQAQFLAMAQIMIYAVGITLVVVIALMLTNPRQEKDSSPALVIHKVPGVLVSVLLFFTIHMAVRSEVWDVSAEAMRAENVEILGLSLMTYYALPFELASVLLLAAMMGAVMLAKAEPGADAQPAGAKTGTQPSERADDVVKV